MSDEEKQFIADAIKLIKAGQRKEAEGLLFSLLMHNRDNVRAWALMVRIAKTPREARAALQEVLRLRPNDAWATETLERLVKDEEMPALPDEQEQVVGDDFVVQQAKRRLQARQKRAEKRDSER